MVRLSKRFPVSMVCTASGLSALRSKATEEVPNVLGCEAVLLALVVGDAVACLFDCQRAEPSRLAKGRARHRLADAVNLRLIETRELPLRAVRGFHEVARLLHRHEVFISRHDALRANF